MADTLDPTEPDHLRRAIQVSARVHGYGSHLSSVRCRQSSVVSGPSFDDTAEQSRRESWQ